VRAADDSGQDEFTLPPPSDPRAAWAAKQVAPAETTVTGVLAFDDIEGGCSFLATDGGRRYEVIYPEGWTLDRRRAELRGPDDCVARAGDPVTVRGTVATDRSSICQVGPIFLASAVEIPPV
jgi:hypothetical protein